MVYVVDREAIPVSEPFDDDRDIVCFLHRRGHKTITEIHQVMYDAKKDEYRIWDGTDHTEVRVK